MKDIDLIYVTGKTTYNGIIVRKDFLDQMSNMASWFQNCNFNALKLQSLIPDIVSIKINDDIIETQDVPFIVYTTVNNPSEQILKLRRPCDIIWDFFKFYCNEAVKNSCK